MSGDKFVGGPDVKRPAPERVTSSVLDHAEAAGNVLNLTSGFGYRNNKGLWPSYNCLDLLTPTSTCPDPMAVDEWKQFSAAEWQPGFTFAVYGGVQCRAIGLDVVDQKAETQRVFEASEGKGIERALAAVRFQASETPGSDEANTPYFGEWDEPTDLTPTTPIPMTVALALLEGDAAANYVGLPWIHMPRAAATILEISGLIVWNGDLAFTKNGSRVCIGGGYDDPEMLASGNWDMYATGEVYVERSEEINLTETVLPGMVDESSDGNPLLENGIMTLAERMYRAAVDCYVAKVTGRVWA